MHTKLTGRSFLRPSVKGKFLFVGVNKFYVKGVTYGTFAPDKNGIQFPSEEVIEKDFSMGICIAIGSITACFGGLTRDVLLNNFPLLFRKEIYAMACIAGGLLYFLLKYLNVDGDLARIICIIAIFTIRVLAFRFKLSLPAFYIEKK